MNKLLAAPIATAFVATSAFAADAKKGKAKPAVAAAFAAKAEKKVEKKVEAKAEKKEEAKK